ncbi:hypothetical protein [Streptomyces musisoli]|nr:hypothetical protein [Streptomyces musisoli]
MAVLAYVVLVFSLSAITLAHWLYPPWRTTPTTDHPRKDRTS